MKQIPPELEGEYCIRIVDMPESARGFVKYDDQDFANVYINAKLNGAARQDAADHEIEHIINDDIHNGDDIRTIEARADGNAGATTIFPAQLSSIPNLVKASDLLPMKPPPKPKPMFKLTSRQHMVLLNCLSELERFLENDYYEY